MKIQIRLLVVALSFCAFQSAYADAPAKRTEIRISAPLRDKLKDLSQSLRMAVMTPIADAGDKIIAIEISKINDPLVRTQLKAEEGDRLTEVVAFKKDAAGKSIRVVFPLLTPVDAMNLYQGLLGATRIEIDLKRKKKIVPMAYVIASN